MRPSGEARRSSTARPAGIRGRRRLHLPPMCRGALTPHTPPPKARKSRVSLVRRSCRLAASAALARGRGVDGEIGMTARRALVAGAIAAQGMAFGAAAQDAPDEVTVAYFLEWPTANQVAQVEGTYAERLGVPVEFRAFGNGNEMTQAMVSGDVDIAYSQGFVPFVVGVLERRADQDGGRGRHLRRQRRVHRARRRGHHPGERGGAGGPEGRLAAGQRHALQVPPHHGASGRGRLPGRARADEPGRRGRGADPRRRRDGLRLRRRARPDEDRGLAADDRRGAGGGGGSTPSTSSRRRTPSRRLIPTSCASSSR